MIKRKLIVSFLEIQKKNKNQTERWLEANRLTRGTKTVSDPSANILAIGRLLLKSKQNPSFFFFFEKNK